MTTLDLFAWVVFPYVAMAVFVVGLFWRYRYDQFGWTTRSSELYEHALLRLGSPLFHFGILFVALGHFMGLLIPMSWTEAVGIGQDFYHFIATYMGSVAGLMTIVGLAILIYRRRKTGPVFLATTRMDKFMYVLLALPIGLGMWATIQTQILGGGGHGYNYRETVSPWLRSLFYFQPMPELMVDVPFQFKLHIIAAFLLFLVWPFTRLIHAFSAPVGYSTRPFIVYRSREAADATRGPKRGWEPVGTPQDRRRTRTRNRNR